MHIGDIGTVCFAKTCTAHLYWQCTQDVVYFDKTHILPLIKSLNQDQSSELHANLISKAIQVQLFLVLATKTSLKSDKNLFSYSKIMVNWCAWKLEMLASLKINNFLCQSILRQMWYIRCQSYDCGRGLLPQDQQSWWYCINTHNLAQEMGETHIKKKHHNIENALTSQFEVLESQIQNAVGCWDFSWRYWWPELT